MAREIVKYLGLDERPVFAMLRERIEMSLIVTLPYHPGDAQLLLKSLRWQRELCGQKPHTAILIHDDHWGSRYEGEIKAAATQAYAKVLRYRLPPTPQATWPQGPNWAFQHTATHMQQYGQPWLWLEADAIPMKRDWLEQLEAEYVRGGKAFMGYIVPEFLHMNGVGIYPANTPARIPKAMKSVDNAWDAEMQPEMIRDCHNAPRLIQHAWGVVNGKLHHRDGPPPNFTDPALLRQIDPNAVLIHRDKVGGVIDSTRKLIQLQRSIPLGFCGANVPMPKVEIFIVSYSKDIEYLKYNLQSIRKYATGFSGVTVLVPTHEVHLFQQLVADYRGTLTNYAVHDDSEKWHLGHQIEKCRADYWCPHADFILFSDSDCIFTEPVSPHDYIVNGKPVLVVEEYSRLQNVPWQATVEKALKIPAPYLTMCRHPGVFHPAVLKETRQRIEAAHKMPFADYVFSTRGPFPFGFSEFSTIGTVAILPGWKNKYHIIDLARQPRPKDKLTQFWSHSPPDSPQHLPSVGGTAIPKEIIEKALA